MAESLAPGFLIAVPQLLDGNFHHSVVFLIDHDAGGAFGLVINRPSQMKVGELAETLGIGYEGNPDARVLIGGPVQPDRGLILHTATRGEADSRRLTASLYACSTPESMARVFAEPGASAVCFAGYSGWGPGQLDSEIEQGAWIPAPPDESLIFSDDRDTIWDRALRKLGIDPLFLVRGGSVN